MHNVRSVAISATEGRMRLLELITTHVQWAVMSGFASSCDEACSCAWVGNFE